jgi:hypothetical protein
MDGLEADIGINVANNGFDHIPAIVGFRDYTIGLVPVFANAQA